ncbi:MAG: EAL domain-containing protein [Gammaproteobacteria bacterium]
MYAVFHPEDDTFLGVVSAGQVGHYPQRIFADLLPRPPCRPLQAEASLETCLDRYSTGDAVMPVVDGKEELLGVVTSHSLLQTLLRHQCNGQAFPGPHKKSEKVLYSLLDLLGRQPAANEIGQQGLEMLMNLFGASAAALAIMDEDGKVGEIFAKKMTRQQAEQLVAMPELAITAGKPLHIADLHGDPRTADPRTADLQFYHPDRRSLLVYAVGKGDESRGRIYLLDGRAGILLGRAEEFVMDLFINILGLMLRQDWEQQRRLLLENQLHLSAMVFEHSQAAIIITNSQEQIVAANPAFSLITGYQPQEVIGKTPRILSSGDNDAGFYRRMWQHIAQRGEWQGEIRNRRKNGELYSEWLKINAVYDGKGSVTHYIATFFDITERIHSDEQVNRLINYDSLTGLPNRILAREQIKQGMLAAKDCDKMIALLFIDLDHFKHVNDSLGHLAGDQLLQVVAKRMLSCARSHLRIPDQDALARQGGDEFTLLLFGLDSEDEAAMVAQRLLDSFQEPISVAGRRLYQSLSIGIAIHPRDAASIDELISHADLAMYEAKRSGRNTYCFFDEGMALRSNEILMLKNGLHGALEKNQFFLEYQPRVSIEDERVIAFEALMRWRHPDLGVVPPVKFIPLLEESGLIDRVGDWLLLEACRQCLSWQAATGQDDLVMAVNLSTRQFQNPSLTENIQLALQQSGLAPHCLEIELTESIAIQDAAVTIRTLEQLSRLGINCSLDDFGTGYSSLSYLRDFQLKTLKIDKSFVDRLPRCEKDNAVVRAIVSIAHSLRMRVVAEGVESMEQKEFLLHEGCEEYQGYLFSKPLKAESALNLLKQSVSKRKE